MASDGHLRRQVFYLPGFDPRPPEAYWGLFRREGRRTAERRGTLIEVGDPVRSEDGISLDWAIRSEADGMGAETCYGLLRWDDIVRTRFPRSNLKRLLSIPVLMWRLWREGYLAAFRREARRFHRVIVSVHQIFAGLVVLSIALASGLVALLPETVPLVLRIGLAPVLAYAILGALTWLTRGKPFYVSHLVDDTAYTHEHARGDDADMRIRVDQWAERIAGADGTVDEIVVVGHSSSSFLAVEALDRVLGAHPEFGRRGTRVSLVTIGNVTAWLTLDQRAREQRQALARVAAAEAIGWLDIRAPWDWLSIHLRDPVSASGLDPRHRHRIAVLRVPIEDLIEPASVGRRRWNLFRMHFQLLMSSRRPTGFDYPTFVSGPTPVHTTIAGLVGNPPATPTGTD